MIMVRTLRKDIAKYNREDDLVSIKSKPLCMNNVPFFGKTAQTDNWTGQLFTINTVVLKQPMSLTYYIKDLELHIP